MTYDHLSPLAQKLGAWMARQCENGLPGHFGDELLEAFSDSGKNHIRADFDRHESRGIPKRLKV